MKPLVLQISLIFVLTAAIFLYGSTDLWWEAAFFAAVFALQAVQTLLNRDDDSLDKRPRFFFPLVLLAVYSALQGAIPIAFGEQTPAFLPSSLDPLISLWSAVKIVGLLVFVKLILRAFGKQPLVLLHSLVAVAAVFAILGIVRFLWQLSDASEDGYFLLPYLSQKMGFGFFINQNHFAYLMLLGLGLGIGRLVAPKASRESRFVFLAVNVCLWSALVLTASRGGIISSFAQILFVVVASFVKPPAVQKIYAGEFWKNQLSKLAVCAVLLAVFVFGVVWFGQERVIRRFDDIPNQLRVADSADAVNRLEIWQATARIVRENWFYGVGFGGFKVAVSKHLHGSSKFTIKQAHNDYLEFAASVGVVGTLLLLWSAIRLFGAMRYDKSEKRGGQTMSLVKNARFAAAAAILGVAVHSWFDFGLQFAGLQFFFCAVVCLLIFPPASFTSKKIASPNSRKS